MPADVKKNGGVATHTGTLKIPVTTGTASAPTSMLVADYVVYSGLHAEEDLSHNG